MDRTATNVPFPYPDLSLHMASAHRGGTDDVRWVMGTGVAWHVEAEITRG